MTLILSTMRTEPEYEFVAVEPIINVFCPTGKGGGIDATCGSGSKSISRPKYRRTATGQLVERSPSSTPASKPDQLRSSTRQSSKIDPETIKMLKASRKLNNAEINKKQATKAIKAYTDKEYEVVNNSLRKGASINEISPDMKNLNKLAQQEIGSPVVTYRGVTKDVFSSHYEGLKPGSEVIAKGFVSTTLDKSTAVGFGTGNTVLEIKAKRGLYVDDLSSNKGEMELLQAHGTRYRFLGTQESILSGSGRSTPTKIVMLEEI